MKIYLSRLITHKFKIDALQHMTSKQSQMGQNAGHRTHAPHSTFNMAGGITTRATMRSEKNRDTKKQLEVQRKERWANTKAMSSMFPHAVIRIIMVSMNANNHGPLPVMSQALAVETVLLRFPAGEPGK